MKLRQHSFSHTSSRSAFDLPRCTDAGSFGARTDYPMQISDRVAHSPKSQPRPTVTMQPETPRRALPPQLADLLCDSQPSLSHTGSNDRHYTVQDACSRQRADRCACLRGTFPSYRPRPRARTASTAAGLRQTPRQQGAAHLRAARYHQNWEQFGPTGPIGTPPQPIRTAVEPVITSRRSIRFTGRMVSTFRHAPRCDSCPICNNLPLVVCPESGDTLRE